MNKGNKNFIKKKSKYAIKAWFEFGKCYYLNLNPNQLCLNAYVIMKCTKIHKKVQIFHYKLCNLFKKIYAIA